MSHKVKKSIANFMNRLYDKGLTTTGGGNISYKKGDKIYITASQTDKGNMKPSQIGVIDLDGKNQTPHIKLSMETQMHLLIYAQRSDINAIVHAHPFTATTLTAEKNLINTNFNGETRAMVGVPAFAKYQLMGTDALATEAAKAAKQSNVILLQHHGILTLGKNLLEAFDRLELTEMAARATVIRAQMRIKEKLSEEELGQIDKLGHSKIP